MKKLGAEFILGVMALPFLIWVVTSVKSLEAETRVLSVKTDEIITVKQKIDYIYQYLIEKNGGK